MLYDVWRVFVERTSPEAKFARVMDNLQPMMLNAATDGKAWEEHQVKLSQILGRNAHTADGSKILWEYAYDSFIRPNLDAGRIEDDRKGHEVR